MGLKACYTHYLCINSEAREVIEAHIIDFVVVNRCRDHWQVKSTIITQSIRTHRNLVYSVPGNFVDSCCRSRPWKIAMSKNATKPNGTRL